MLEDALSPLTLDQRELWEELVKTVTALKMLNRKCPKQTLLTNSIDAPNFNLQLLLSGVYVNSSKSVLQAGTLVILTDDHKV